MSAVLPHFKTGPANYQVSTLVIGGQVVEPTTPGSTTDFTIKPAGAASVVALGVASKDANVLANQTGAPNAYGMPQIDVSVLDDFTSVYYGGVDIWCWYSAAAGQGARLKVGATGTVVPWVLAGEPAQLFGICTQPGGVAAGQLAANTLIGGGTYFLGRVRVTI